MTEKGSRNWAQSVLDLVQSSSTDLCNLVQAAGLDPSGGEVSAIDLSELDLSGQSLSGWDLRYARFDGTNLAGADLTGCLVDPKLLAQAHGLPSAKMEDDLRAALTSLPRLKLPIEWLLTNRRTAQILRRNGIETLGDLVRRTEAELLRQEGVGRKSLLELREIVKDYHLSFGMNIWWSSKESEHRAIDMSEIFSKVMDQIQAKIAHKKARFRGKSLEDLIRKILADNEAEDLFLCRVEYGPRGWAEITLQAGRFSVGVYSSQYGSDIKVRTFLHRDSTVSQVEEWNLLPGNL
jgi:hypothetical protein